MSSQPPKNRKKRKKTMSLKTWKEEFYPHPANETNKGIPAILHSLSKWRGLNPSNLKRHRLEIGVGGKLYDKKIPRNSLEINADSCSLCYHYMNSNYLDNCITCPIYWTHERRCTTLNSLGLSEWKIWLHSFNPKPMIKLLEKTLKLYRLKNPAKIELDI
jgi:hypothetical protein